jgi:hypothetical protein
LIEGRYFCNGFSQTTKQFSILAFFSQLAKRLKLKIN